MDRPWIEHGWIKKLSLTNAQYKKYKRQHYDFKIF
jgi:hypothetical protein